MNAPLPEFQRFQFAFARHVRDPRGAARPAGVPARRMGLYNELLYNNIENSLNACFPVARALLGVRRWPRLVRAFFRDWRCLTPHYREIPREFVRYLTEMAEGQPAWLAELAHYEWAELAVDTMDAPPAPACDAEGDLLDDRPVLAPALMSLAYAWPVHRIGPAHRPRQPAATHLLVFRRTDDTVGFMELNPVSARLVALLQEDAPTGRAAALRIAAELSHPQPEAVVAGASAVLSELRAAGAIYGARS
ncbi:MAG: putative DNA-binding domain-containing protein [Rhodocyclaceae bacterium]|jgi:hypothetical protein|nr:hypothetical protein [Rhodocyclaceae bacterium]MCC6658779.1 putative DNA-binding domain-containing protein [Rhodocyclaceae bacterium]MCL4681603.1 putative DNA-binding domain-containing protein [Rhodocyclaceae bacterium]